MNYLEKCQLCPRNCKVNRLKDEKGFCKAPEHLKIARAALHFFEEPCISGKTGSGAIFFSHCNLKCIFCQNYDISTKNNGKEISTFYFADLCVKLQNEKANNINLVTPTPYIPQIIEGIKLAKEKGLKIPIIYNTSSYENIEALKLLKGTIDIYLPDFKYYDNDLGEKFSSCKNYRETAINAIKEMYDQVGPIQFDKKKMITKGMIVRHLLLPNHIEDSKKIIKYLYDTYKDNIYISIMNQYTPVRKLEYDELNKIVTNSEYDELINYAYDLGIRNAFIQEGETQKESFIPDFTKYNDL